MPLIMREPMERYSRRFESELGSERSLDAESTHVLGDLRSHPAIRVLLRRDLPRLIEPACSCDYQTIMMVALAVISVAAIIFSALMVAGACSFVIPLVIPIAIAGTSALLMGAIAIHRQFRPAINFECAVNQIVLYVSKTVKSWLGRPDAWMPFVSRTNAVGDRASATQYKCDLPELYRKLPPQLREAAALYGHLAVESSLAEQVAEQELGIEAAEEEAIEKTQVMNGAFKALGDMGNRWDWRAITLVALAALGAVAALFAALVVAGVCPAVLPLMVPLAITGVSTLLAGALSIYQYCRPSMYQAVTAGAHFVKNNGIKTVADKVCPLLEMPMLFQPIGRNG